MTVFRIDNGNMIFHTHKTRSVCVKLAINPKVELCFCSVRGDFEVRISGLTEPVEDADSKREIDSTGFENVAVYQVDNTIVSG